MFKNCITLGITLHLATCRPQFTPDYHDRLVCVRKPWKGVTPRSAPLHPTRTTPLLPR